MLSSASPLLKANEKRTRARKKKQKQQPITKNPRKNPKTRIESTIINDDEYDFLNTYKRFDSTWAAEETLGNCDCIENHRLYRGHWQAMISMS